ncbi:MAG: DUF262 domain-containing protein [Flavobacteriales bacterium]|nr:MAG: DUF262 domain-containing protein [Flavobacteriales bacterium]
MADLKPLSSLFNQALFRVPDYQRGYAWTQEQLEDLWSDLVNLSQGGQHYTGVLTLKEITADKVKETDNEHWLITGGHKLYHIIDGQQRLTSCMILIQIIIEQVRLHARKNNPKATDSEIAFADQYLKVYVDRYLYADRAGSFMRTYKFGYHTDNPSDRYYRHAILKEEHGGDVEQTFYTLNLHNAQTYFTDQVRSLLTEGLSAVERLFKKLTVGFLFNEYVIPAGFDEYVAFETMNNRGKRLSTLELLKNRLIYLSTLYKGEEADASEKEALRTAINDAWKGVYHELGRNRQHPLNDDEFLRAHWILYFMYSRRKGDDHIDFLLKEFFTSKRIHEKVPVEVELESFEELKEDAVDDDENGADDTEVESRMEAQLTPKELKDYAGNLRETSHGWYLSWFPHAHEEVDREMADWVDRLNRLPMFYARPMVTTLLLRNDIPKAERITCLKAIERCFFLLFRLSGTKANFGSSEFYNLSRDVHHKRAGTKAILEQVEKQLSWAMDGGKFRHELFTKEIENRYSIKSSAGFYKWSGLQYFLYEYEEHLRGRREERKLDWNDLVRRQDKKKLSIEHVLPQTPTEPYWDSRVKHLDPVDLNRLTHCLGNLLPLSRSINSSYQNDGFTDKVDPKLNAKGEKVRTGYREGCYSEIEVSTFTDWDVAAIQERGLRMLKFMEQRWEISLGGPDDKIKLLHLTSFQTANGTVPVQS